MGSVSLDLDGVMGPVFLDLDGVVCDFDKGFEKLTNTKIDRKNFGIDFMELLGMTGEEFWESMSASNWADLPMTEDADEILTVVEKYKPIILSAHPGYGQANCVAGKIRWIKMNMPDYFKEDRWFFGRRKEQLAFPGAILIDDQEYNINKWAKAGGTSILVPRPWNILGRTNLDTATYISNRLRWLGAQNENKSQNSLFGMGR